MVDEETVGIHGIPFDKDGGDFVFPRGRLNLRQAVWSAMHFATLKAGERKR